MTPLAYGARRPDAFARALSIVTVPGPISFTAAASAWALLTIEPDGTDEGSTVLTVTPCDAKMLTGMRMLSGQGRAEAVACDPACRGGPPCLGATANTTAPNTTTPPATPIRRRRTFASIYSYLLRPNTWNRLQCSCHRLTIALRCTSEVPRQERRTRRLVQRLDRIRWIQKGVGVGVNIIGGPKGVSAVLLLAGQPGTRYQDS